MRTRAGGGRPGRGRRYAGLVRRVLIVNPIATGVTGARTAAVTAELAAGGPIETLVTEGPGHAAELARGCADCSAIYVFAGDGGFITDDGGVVDFAASAFDRSGLRLLHPGQRVTVLTDGSGRVELVTLPGFRAGA